VDPAWIARFAAAGDDIEALVERALAADAAVHEGIPDDVTVGLHICRGRMEQAAALVDRMDRLAISPQCGFASVLAGNETNEDAQWRKLELVARVADRLWG
jgi:methionine synthase II (cobalamin-independent)